MGAKLSLSYWLGPSYGRRKCCLRVGCIVSEQAKFFIDSHGLTFGVSAYG
jgi:hypothetical protein